MAGIDEPQDGNSSFALNAGQRVGAGRFNLMRQLGRGGMGVVWLAFDERLQEAVALKFLPPEIAADAMALDDLRRETRKSRRLTHPNIIRIHDLYEALDEPAFISMEYVEGSNLTALRLENEQRCFTWAVVAPLALQLCQALEYAHGEKVVHRDLKPANVMLDGDGRLKLADFGIAGTISDSASRISARFSTSGTLAYMSPQQMNGEKPRVTDDIYSLGATLYELLTSRPPFNGGDIPHQVRNVPATPMAERLAEFEITNAIPGSASALIMACLAKEATQRPQSARAVMERIQSSYDGDVSPAGLAQAVAAAEAQEAYKPEEAAPAEGSRGWMVWAAALTVVVLAIGGAAWYFAGHRAGSSEVQKKSVPEQKADTGQPADGANGVRSTTVHAPPIRDGLVLYFNFDEPPKNGVVPDESGSGNDGKVVNVQWTAQGRHGGAMQFSRSNSYITVPNRPSLNPAQITVAAWVKTSYSGSVWLRIFDKAYAKGYALSVGGDFGRWHQQGLLVWETGGHSSESQQLRIDDGRWHFVAGSYDGAVQRLYLDGQLLPKQIRWQGRVPANNFDLTIGANHSTLDNNDEFNASFDGLIDEAMIFNRALSPEEIRQLYDAAPTTQTEPVQVAPGSDWITLFDGTTVYGWAAANSTEFPDDAWSLQDGCLENIPGGPKTTIYTREKFRDFELEFEWRIGYGGNSGIFYSQANAAIHREFQLVDNDQADFPTEGRWTYHEENTGALWGVIAPSGNFELSPFNEWNRGKLLVQGTHVEHWVNGVKVVEYELGGAELGRKIAQTPVQNAKDRLKGQTKVIFMQPGDVPIGLSIQGGQVAFRNIRIRRLGQE